MRLAVALGVLGHVGQLVLNVSGWNKLVLMDADRVFLFPRSADGVEWFERELVAYRALAGSGLSVVPRLLGRWEDLEIYPFPFSRPSPACAAPRRPRPRPSSTSSARPLPLA